MTNVEAEVSDTFFEGLSAKERASVEKHLALIEAEPEAGHAKAWRRLVAKLRKLAPKAMKAYGQNILQFFIADGKYQMQVFSLEDNKDGQLVIYLPDVIAEATKAKILSKPSGKPAPGTTTIDYPLSGIDGQALKIESLPSNLPDPPIHMKSMLGWNRKAIRVSIPAKTGPQTDAVESLCTLAAKNWAGKS